MPTRRAIVILVLALALYLVANQTQVGWVYIMTSALVGLLCAAFLNSLGMLRKLSATRSFKNLNAPLTASNGLETSLEATNFYEDDLVEVTLALTQTGWRPVFMLWGVETCPFAPSEQQTQILFAPALFRNEPVTLQYQAAADRRGAHTFPDIRFRSGGAFTFFRTRHTLAVPGELLIYPQYQPLKRMRLLENRGFTDRYAMRTGNSSEVIGTREYRSGDSLRKIHWRTTARAGKLVVKEFSDTDHLTITVVLDLAAQPDHAIDKYSPFETAIRVAASLGYFATHKNIPFRLVGRSTTWRIPNIAFSWWGVLHSLARVERDGDTPLAEVLRQLKPVPFVVVLISSVNENVLKELTALPKRGTHVLAIFISAEGTLPPAALDLHYEMLHVRAIQPEKWREQIETI
jgi:uncharacterized protein (DUF58 family)